MNKAPLPPDVLRRCVPWAAVVLLLWGASACGRGHFYGGTNLSPPTVVVPEYTNQPALPLRGARPENAEVWITYLTPIQLPTIRLAAAASSTHYVGPGTLSEGPNTFTLQARRGSAQGPQSAVYSVILKTSLPAVPVITSPDGFYLNGQAQVNGVLSGTRDKNTSIHVTGPGLDVTMAADPNASSWSVPIILNYGPSNFTVQATDLAGNQSALVSVAVRGTRVPSPTIAASSYRSPTKVATYTLNGGKPAPATLYWVLDGSAPRVVGTNAGTSWSGPSFTMVQERAYLAAVYAIDGANERSATATANIMYDITPPAAPSGFIPNLGNLAATGNDHLTLTAMVPADGFLCVSSSSAGNCDLCPLGDPNLYPGNTGCLVCATAAPNASCVPYNSSTAPRFGGAITLKVPLHDADSPGYANGQNPLFLTSQDAAGNNSPASTGTIYRIAPPTVNLSAPVNGAVVSSNSLTLIFTIQTSNVDAIQTPEIRAGAALAVVQVCIDGLNCQNLSPHGDGSINYSDVVDLSQLVSGSTHSLTLSVTDAIGATTTVTQTFTYQGNDPLYLSNTGARQNSQNVASVFDSAGNLHLVWSDYCVQDGNAICKVSVGLATQSPDIFYSRRSPAGVWSPIVDVSSTNRDDGRSTSPSLAVDGGGRVHLAWVDDGAIVGLPLDPNAKPSVKPLSASIVHRMIYAGGNAVDSNIYIVGSPVQDVVDGDPSLTGDISSGTGLHLAFRRNFSGQRYDVWYTYFNGSSWSAPQQVTTDPNTGIAERPSVVGLSSGHAWVAWQECSLNSADGNNYCPGNPTGLTPNRDIRMREVLTVSSLGPSIITVSDALKSALLDGDSLHVSLTADASNLWLFWDDQPQKTAHRGIWTRTYNLAGGTLSPYVQVSDPNIGTDAATPSASLIYNSVASTGTVAVAWSQNLPVGFEPSVATPQGPNASIFVRVEDLNVGSFDRNAERSAYTKGVQATAPALALDAQSNLHLAWQDIGTLGSLNQTDRANLSGPLERIFYKFLPRFE